MKEKGFVFFICMVLALISFSSIKAETTFKETKNLIDLRNIYLEEQEPTSHRPAKRFLKMTNFIDVVEGEVYTIIIHEHFLEQDFDYFNNLDDNYHIHLIYDDETTDQVPTDSVGFHEFDEFGYIWGTFTAKGNKVKIDYMNARVSSEVERMPFKIIMYLGEIDDFSVFYSYHTNFEQEVGTLLVDVDCPLSIEAILEAFVFESDDDNLITINIIEDNYSDNVSQIGEYLIKLKAQDEYINASFYDLKVKVVDIEPPIIRGKDSYIIDFSEVDNFSLNSIKEQLIVNDNYSNISNSDLEIISDDFTDNKNKAGEYQVVFRAVDCSQNYTDFPVMITVADNKPPVLIGPLEIYRYSTDPEMTREEIKALYQAYDEVDGDLSDLIEVGGITSSEVGTHEFLITVEDNSGNKASKRLYLKIVEGVPPVFTTTNLILTISEYNEMTQEDIIAWIIENSEANISDVEIVFDEVAYTNDARNIYYSFIHEGQQLQGKIEVRNDTNDKLWLYPVISGFVFLAVLTAAIIVVKRRKR
ncbi:MAG: hypothetical protein PHY22_03775 [Acholeplasmataceae bacterium]|nr:hypothetical protein [Acholeplasmataceae bacterium]